MALHTTSSLLKLGLLLNRSMYSNTLLNILNGRYKFWKLGYYYCRLTIINEIYSIADYLKICENITKKTAFFYLIFNFVPSNIAQI